MRLQGSRLLAFVLFGLYMALTGWGRQTAQTQTATSAPKFTMLVFTKTTVYRHESIPTGIMALKALGAQHNFQVDASEDATVITPENLARYRVVIFLNTSGDILDAGQQAAFERFIQRGGGFVGIHSATDTEYEWPWYEQLIGAYVVNHSTIQAATVKVLDASHASTKPLPATWIRHDEWYNFPSAPNPTVQVLLSIDETTYTGGSMGEHHPISWYHQYDGGRAWYTAMGHTTESYHEPLFLQHILGGIMWAAGATTD